MSDNEVVVQESLQELSNGDLVFGPPKTDAGVRTVTIPSAVMGYVTKHLAEYAATDSDALLLTTKTSRPVRRATLYKKWKDATEAVGLSHLHFHDLRHTGNVLAASTGASTKDLMSRMGHASARAA